MQAIRSINNNVAICIDAGGNECVAMGKGIGFGKMPRDVALSEVTHTYYSVDLRLLEGIKEIPQDVLLFAARAAEHVRAELSYALSPNMAFLLADHIAFAIKRAREHLQVRMPLAYDVEHNYPEEYRVGQRLVRQIRKEFLVDLGDDEAAGIAMNLVNSRFESVSEQDAARSQSDDIMLEEITEIVEEEFGLRVDRASFAFSRYATHLHYLFARLHRGEVLRTEAISGLEGLFDHFPEGVACVERIADHIMDAWGVTLDADEKLYLVLHISRICIKAATAPPAYNVARPNE